MRHRSSLLARTHGQRGAGTTEYVILLILAALGAVYLYAKFGRTVGGKVDVAGRRVETLGDDQGGHIVERSAPPRSAGAEGGSAGGSAGEGTRSGSSGGGTGSDSGSATGAYSSPQLLPDRIDNARDARPKKLDTRVAVILGIIVVAIGALMILAVARGLKKEEKKARKPPVA